MPRTRGLEAVIATAGAGGPVAPALPMVVVLALATLVSEDLTCIAAGLLVAGGKLRFWTAATACFVGILVGDLLLVAAGRWLGRPALRRRPLSWFVTPESVERSARWFARRGARAVFLSRFVPGSRLPLFVAAGILHAPLGRLTAALAVAGAIWTPLLVGLSAATHGAIRNHLQLWGQFALPVVFSAAAIVLLVVEILVPALSWRGRRLLLSRWRRITWWEFWPLWLFQLPVVLHWLWLGVRFRHWTLFTAANPGIPAGGFLLESKSQILSSIAEPGVVPRFSKLDLPDSESERVDLVARSHEQLGLGFPVVGKPDVGERGEGVTILRDAEALREWAVEAPREAILQEYAFGAEFGVFYVRRPGEASGTIFSITRKQFPEIVGDGQRTVEELILADDRAVCMAPLYLEKNVDRLETIPAQGERLRLVEIGNHCRGAVFRDGRSLATPALARRIDEIAKSFDGFFFGRFDLRTESEETLCAGVDLRILELNGVTSEATHIYEPGASLLEAYRTLFAQWRLCFEIGAANAALGARPTPLRELLALLHERRKLRQRSWLPVDAT